MARKPLGQRAMTPAERQRRYRERQRKPAAPVARPYDQARRWPKRPKALDRISTAALIDELDWRLRERRRRLVVVPISGHQRLYWHSPVGRGSDQDIEAHIGLIIEGIMDVIERLRGRKGAIRRDDLGDLYWWLELFTAEAGTRDAMYADLGSASV